MPRFASRLAVLAFALLLAGCQTSYKLQQRFDDEPLGNKPAQFPAPNPPNDDLLWTTQFATSRVATAPTGGAEARTIRGGTLGVKSPAQALLADTETFAKPGNNIRGHIKARLTGSGHVWIAFRAWNSTPGSFLGGYLIEGHPGGGSVGTLRETELDSAITMNSWVAWCCSGTFLSGYSTEGTPLELNWSVDQASHIINLGGPGNTTSLVFPAASAGGVANTPLQKLQISVWLVDFDASTVLSLDDLTVEEFN